MPSDAITDDEKARLIWGYETKKTLIHLTGSQSWSDLSLSLQMDQELLLEPSGVSETKLQARILLFQVNVFKRSSDPLLQACDENKLSLSEDKVWSSGNLRLVQIIHVFTVCVSGILMN